MATAKIAKRLRGRLSLLPEVRKLTLNGHAGRRMLCRLSRELGHAWNILNHLKSIIY